MDKDSRSIGGIDMRRSDCRVRGFVGHDVRGGKTACEGIAYDQTNRYPNCPDLRHASRAERDCQRDGCGGRAGGGGGHNKRDECVNQFVGDWRKSQPARIWNIHADYGFEWIPRLGIHKRLL